MATVLMSSSRQAEMIRSAISPRLAIRIFLNTRERLSGRQSNPEELLPVLDRLAVARIDGDDLPLDVRLDLVHQLHRLDDAENFTLRHARTQDRKSTRLNSSHVEISYAVFCLKKKKKKQKRIRIIKKKKKKQT